MTSGSRFFKIIIVSGLTLKRENGTIEEYPDMVMNPVIRKYANNLPTGQGKETIFFSSVYRVAYNNDGTKIISFITVAINEDDDIFMLNITP